MNSQSQKPTSKFNLPTLNFKVRCLNFSLPTLNFKVRCLNFNLPTLNFKVSFSQSMKGLLTKNHFNQVYYFNISYFFLKLLF
jgi:hypothetical protein